MKTVVTENNGFIIEKLEDNYFKIEVYERFDKGEKGISYLYLDTIYTDEEVAKDYGY